MTDWTKLRSAWKTERDKHVKKGAVTGVSIGDAIEAVVSAQSKGYTTLQNALNALDKAVEKYAAKLGKEHPKLIKWMETNLTAAAKETRGRVAMDIDSLKWTTDNLLAGSNLNILTILPDSGKLVNINRNMKADQTLTFTAAMKQIDTFYVVETYGALLVKRAQTLKAMKWHARLDKHDADYAALTEMADVVLDDVKQVLIWSKVQDLGEFADKWKAMKTKVTALDLLAPAQKAMKHLLA